MAETFTCEECGGTFDKEWTDDEALDEANELWSREEQSAAGLAIVCHDCWLRLMELPC